VVTPDIYGPVYVTFPPVPAGTYEVRYERGAMAYVYGTGDGADRGWEVQTGVGSNYGWHVVVVQSDSTTEDFFAGWLSTPGTKPTPQEAEAGCKGNKGTFTKPLPFTVSMYLLDNPYGNNITWERTPSFTLVPQGAP
jgi:hypothetical protein